jgi:3-hydroxyacyl-CoA dehydrogenase
MFRAVDEVGNDVSYHVASFMIKAGDLGDRLRGGNPDLMKNLVAKGLLGRKAGKGFYLYPKETKKGAKQINPEFLSVLKEINGGKTVDVSVEDIQGRMMTRFVNECAFSLQDGIIRAPADGEYTVLSTISCICYQQ